MDFTLFFRIISDNVTEKTLTIHMNLIKETVL